MTTKAKLKQDIFLCLNKLNALIREYSFEDSAPPNATIAGAINRLAQELSTTPEKIRIKSNEPQLVLPRQICQYVMRTALSATYPEIAHATGLGDHTTIIHSCRKIERMREANPEFDKKIRRLCGLFMDRPNSQEDVA